MKTRSYTAEKPKTLPVDLDLKVVHLGRKRHGADNITSGDFQTRGFWIHLGFRA